MHGTILHYDPLTQCGLLRTPAGQVQYFRLDEVTSTGPFRAGQPVALRNGVLVDTGGSRVDVNPRFRTGQPPATSAGYVSVQPQVRARQGFGWLGGALSVGTLLLLLLVGGQSSGYASPNPKLIDSTFGVAAAALLVVEAIVFFFGGSRRQRRWAYWLTVWSSLFAYVSQVFNGFEADDLAAWYGYALLILGFTVYVLPYRK